MIGDTPIALQATPMLAARRARELADRGRKRWTLDLICQQCGRGFQQHTLNRCDPATYCSVECVSAAARAKSEALMVSRFWGHVDVNGPTPEDRPELGPCWIWTLKPTNWGYGRFIVAEGSRSKQVLAHRFSYESQVGPVADGFELDHLCRNRRCVKPAHLEAVTHQVNVLRGESPAAIAARRPHCTNGHDWSDPAVFYVTPEGIRQCRVCQRLNRRKRDAQKAVEAARIHAAVCRWRPLACSTCSDLNARAARLEASCG